MSKENGVDLTRRKALLGLGTVGVAGAGATLGTSAYFSDEELFEDNSLEAGELDLYVHYEFTADQDGVEGDNFGEPTSGTVQGDVDVEEEDEVSVSYDLADVKPGDSGGLEFCFSIVDNPAYLWTCGELTANDENGRPEPEMEVDDSGGDPGAGNGELADAIDAWLYYTDGDEMGDEIVSGSLREVLIELQAGVALDGDGNGEAGVEGRAPFDGGDTAEEPTDDTCVYLGWEVPTDVGNEIQTDSIEFDLTFYAEQARHNDGATNPCVDATFTSEEVYVHRTSDLGFGNEQVTVSDINAATEEGASELEPTVIEVSYGSEVVVYNVHPALGMEDPSNMAIGFDPEADGGAWDNQVLWESGGAGFTYVENGGIAADPATVPGVWAAYDDESDVFTIAVERSSLEADGNGYRLAMQSIHEPGAPNNPLNPSGSNARIDAELPSGFDWGDTSTWQDDTLP